MLILDCHILLCKCCRSLLIEVKHWKWDLNLNGLPWLNTKKIKIKLKKKNTDWSALNMTDTRFVQLPYMFCWKSPGKWAMFHFAVSGSGKSDFVRSFFSHLYWYRWYFSSSPHLLTHIRKDQSGSTSAPLMVISALNQCLYRQFTQIHWRHIFTSSHWSKMQPKYPLMNSLMKFNPQHQTF